MAKLYRFKTITSTNDEAKKSGYVHGDVILSLIQTKGRGQYSRQWDSSAGGVWMSIVLNPAVNKPQEFTDIAAFSVKAVLKELYSVNTTIKKPNDLLYKGRKICGILTENLYKGKSLKMVIGIGLNVNNTISSEFSSIGVSLKEIIGSNTNRDKLIKKIISLFFDMYKKKKN